MTTDLLISVDIEGEKKDIAQTVKPSTELKSSRIMTRYWSEHMLPDDVSRIPSVLAKVGRNGVKVNSIYYNCDEFTKSDIAGTQVPVLYDRLNTGIIYCFVRGRWGVSVLR